MKRRESDGRLQVRTSIFPSAAVGGAEETSFRPLTDRLHAMGLKAGDWVREAAKATGGGGGGRPQMAQAGGKDPSKLPDALKVAREFAAKVTEARVT